MKQAYEELTVPELKDLAFNRGIDIPSDARKADIIEALEAQDSELGVSATPTESQPEVAQSSFTWGTSPGTPVFCQMSSTVGGSFVDNDTTHKIKRLS